MSDGATEALAEGAAREGAGPEGWTAGELAGAEALRDGACEATLAGTAAD